MLKALELIGFKSFADKTRFEFPAGITVVVGPNGSGKSNIVDAIKWVLGEQSAKSLRGKDMADVIFKGAGSGGRKAMNTAEATIIIDNSEGRLAIDAPEVHVTRRVYRSGEGEYLINRQPCRLKDVRHLFRGTGVGTDAYSLIEQGKVDRLLQASPRERRAIFEEAAGISRFKAKKIEAQRRLERVQQNLVRLSDIVDEVESRLRSVRSQASKARRYREHSQRLQQLRTHVGRTDYRQLSEELTAAEDEIARLSQQAELAADKAASLDSNVQRLQTEIEACGEEIRQCESIAAGNREQIAAIESTAEHQRGRVTEVEEAAQQRRARIAAMNSSAGDLRQRLDLAIQELQAAEANHAAIAARLDAENESLSQLAARMRTLRAAVEENKSKHVEQMRSQAALSNKVSSLQSDVESEKATAERRTKQLDELDQQLQEHQARQQLLTGRQQRLDESSREKSSLVDELRQKLADTRRRMVHEQKELAALEGRQRGASQRAAILQDLETRQEGLSSGVKDVLARAREGESRFHEVCGLVADLLEVDVEIAPLVDAALGAAAQYVVVQGDALTGDVQTRVYRPPGRVGFVHLHDEVAQPAGDAAWENRDDVIGRADRFVQAAPQHAPLVRHLLGRTWLVKDLAAALRLRQTTHGEVCFVTASAEVLQPDGAVVVGPRGAAGGLISRRSELRALQLQVSEFGQRIETAKHTVAQLEQDFAACENDLQSRSREKQNIDTELSAVRAHVRGAKERGEQLDKQRTVLQEELNAAQAKHDQAEADLQQSQQQLEVTEAELAELEEQIKRDDVQLAQWEAQREQRSQQATAAKVEHAASLQKLQGLRTQTAQFEDDRRERGRALRDAHEQLNTCLRQLDESNRAILRAGAELAELFLQKEALADQANAELRRRGAVTEQRAAAAQQLQAVRGELHRVEEQQHKQELTAGDVRHRRDALVERLREDYGLEVSDLQQQEDQEQAEREKIEEEIAELRAKINRIGAVNLDALQELDDLETRFLSLSGQHQDLVQAKDALERIISKINSDSRRLFIETLDAIRENFQGLYRKAFGGGSADLALEEGVDILESGVEILATPPGKPSFNNSLLSGGERALTAVALLLAIFQFRPSPFCVLDEVDAPFDEANIGRFIDVLHGFLGWTKFVIVTHSKKTMTAATTLYGVTMQESGVSKRVSVRFEDVSDDGHISPEALQRDAEQSGDDGQAA